MKGRHRDPTARSGLGRQDQLFSTILETRLSERDLDMLAAVIVLEWPVSTVAALYGESNERTTSRISECLNRLRIAAVSQGVRIELDEDMGWIAKSPVLPGVHRAVAGLTSPSEVLRLR